MMACVKFSSCQLSGFIEYHRFEMHVVALRWCFLALYWSSIGLAGGVELFLFQWLCGILLLCVTYCGLCWPGVVLVGAI